MAKVENLIPEPYTQGMTLDSQCWLAIVVSSDDPTKVIYFNPRGSEEIDFESFVEEFYENYSSFVYSNEQELSVTPDANGRIVAQATAAKASEEEDYDEDHSWKEWVAVGENIKIFNQFDLNNINEEVASMKKELKLIQKDAVNDAKDGALLRKDPDAYYGVKHLFK